MKRNAGCRWDRVAIGALGVLAMVALAIPSAEARVRVSIRSTPKPHVAPSVSIPRVPSPAPGAPKVQLNAPSGRPVSVSAPSAVPARRGFFGRTWDWLLGRRPAPAPAPQVAQAVPAAAPAPRTIPNIVLPVPSGRPGSAPVPPTAQDQEKQGAAGAGRNVSMAAAVKQAFGTREAEAGQRSVGRPAALASGAGTPASKPSGYVLHLTNGRRIPVANYEEKGDQVLIEQRQGTYGLPKSLIARIETKEAGLEAAPTGRGER